MNETTQNNESLKLTELRSYRERKNIQLEALADEIKVSKALIEHIEAGRFEQLGAPAFIRGHVINYSKAVGIDPQDLLSQIPNQFLEHQTLKLSGAMGSSPLARVKRQSNHLGRYAVGTALLGMLGLSFYFIWDKWSLPDTQSVNTSLAEQSDQEDFNGTEKKVTYSSLIPQARKAETVDAVDAPDEPSANGVNEDGQDQDPAKDAEPTDNDSMEANQSSIELLGDTAELADVQTVEQQQVSLSAYVIKMQVAEDAWVSITTADGDKLVHDVLGPGSKEFYSDQPMHFRVGNAANVSVIINEQAIELDSVTARNVADFDWPMNPS